MFRFSAIMIMFLIGQCLQANSINVVKTNPFDYPNMKASFYIFDDSNEPIVNLNKDDFKIIENGRECEIVSLTCPEKKGTDPLSVAMSIDISGSMMVDAHSSIIPVELGKITAKKLVEFLPMPPSEMALQTCHSHALIYRDFTTNKDKLYEAIKPVKAGGGNDFIEHLLNDRTGLLNIAKEGKHKRIAVIYTDAYWHPMSDFEKQKCIDTCIKYDITFFACIYTRPEAMPDGIKKTLQDLADATGGKMFDGIVSNKLATELAEILQMEIYYDPCDIEWKSRNNCSPSVAVELSNSVEGVDAEFAYDIPQDKLARLEIKPKSITFQNVEPGVEKDSAFTIAAYNSDIYVDKITCSNPMFEIEPAEIDLKEGVPQEMKIRYKPIDSAWQYAEIEVESDMCFKKVYSSGFFLLSRPKKPTLKLVHPNGGEVFAIQTDTVITWEGVTPEDTVSLKFSPDRGKTWYLVDDEAYGLEYRWKAPPFPSDECLMKVYQPGEDDSLIINIQDLIGHTGDVRYAEFSRDNKYIITASYDNTAKIWELGKDDPKFTLDGHDLWVEYAEFGPRGKYVVTASYDNTAKVWDLKTGNMVYDLDSHTDWVEQARFSPDGKRLLTVSSDNTGKIWDIETGNELVALKGHTDAIKKGDYSPDGMFVVTASYDYTAKVWNSLTGDLVNTLHHKGVVTNAEFSPDGTMIITSSYDNTAKVWDASTGALIKTLSGHTSLLTDATFSPDSRFAATASYDNSAIVWEINTGTIVHTLTGHTAELNTVDFNYDGTKIITASYDNTAKVWDANSGMEIFELAGHADILNYAGFSSNDSYMVTTSFDNTAKIWYGGEAVQNDISDSLWAIVKPMLTAIDVDMGKSPVSVPKDKLVESFISNYGKYPAVVDSLTFTNNQGEQFKLVSAPPPYTIEPGESLALEFQFKPASVGQQSAFINIHTADSVYRQNIYGIGTEKLLLIKSDLVDFGEVEVYSKKDTAVILLEYMGDDALTINSSEMLGPDKEQFEILDGVDSFVLNKTNPQKELRLRFKPIDIGRTSGQIGFYHDSSATPEIAYLFGEGIGGLLYVEDDSAYAGETKELIIRSSAEKGIKLSEDIVKCAGVLKAQKSILTPKDFDKIVKIDGDMLYFSFESSVSALNDDNVVATVDIIAGLGSVLSTNVDFEEFHWYDTEGNEIGDIYEKQSGEFTLLGVCKEGGYRLLNIADQEAGIINISPLPAGQSIDVDFFVNEAGLTEICIYNLMGENIKTIYSEDVSGRGLRTLTEEVGFLSSGRYFLRFKTPTLIKNTSFIIVK